MESPLEIDYRHIQASPAIESAIRESVDKLQRFHPHILGCAVTVDAAHRHRRKKRQYTVHLRLRVPGQVIAVSRDDGEGHEDLYIALRDAFDAARRQLEDHARVSRGEVKTHPAAADATQA